MISSPSTVLTSPNLSIKFTSSSPPPSPRVSLPPPFATATTTDYSYSYTPTENQYQNQNNKSTYLGSPRRSMASSPSSLYEVLRVPIGASGEEIKSAYRQLARTCHPDVSMVSIDESSADEFIKIHAAYSTLSDPETRADYDRKLYRRNYRRQPLTVATPSGASGYGTGRNWETDQCW